MSVEILIAGGPATSDAAQHCLRRYYQELEQRFDGGFDPRKSVLRSLDEFLPPKGAFLVMRMDGNLAGCGGLTPLGPAAAYLKRMWIAPEARGHGLGRRLLASLEERAREIGYTVVKLETHSALTEAQRLYCSAGYREVPAFNQERYAHHWFEKRLD
ncbi:MAG: GNAT family N-acetyltransferase [Actinobacteria bacterium]|nr:GNAT family N-acetyltransferase [Actinomycetota bacterium]